MSSSSSSSSTCWSSQLCVDSNGVHGMTNANWVFLAAVFPPVGDARPEGMNYSGTSPEDRRLINHRRKNRRPEREQARD